MTPFLVAAALWFAFAAPGDPPILPALDTRRIDAAFAEVDRPDSPGCAAGVVVAGRIAYARGYGLASLEQQVPITPRTVFDLGSTSKQITSAAVALLVLDGKLSLEDDVRKYIPELPDYGKPITVRRLLDHTSGLRDYTDVLSLDGHHEEDLTTTPEGLEAMTRQKVLNFPTGEEFRYTNSGHFLASILVQRVSGKTLRAFAAERIFAPLGMTGTTYLDDHALVVPGRATGYAPRDGDGGGFETSMSDWEQVGDGGVQSSIEDLARWADNLETGKVGGRPLIDMMHTSGRLNDGTPTGYGLGLFMRTHRGLRLVTHGGAWAGFRANLLRVPERRIAAIVLCNVANANTERLGLAAIDAALDALPMAERPPAENAAADKPSPAPVHVDAALFYNEHLGQSLRLDDIVRDRTVRVEFAPGGRTVTIDDPEDSAKPRVYTRAEATKAEVPLKALAGTYTSDAIKAPCEVVTTREKDQDGLALHCGGGQEGPLRPLAPGLYDVGWGVARFATEPGGKSATLTLTMRGLVDLKLRKKP
jgi:CubicO group peptidase (beta-lactamase class C family)